MNGVIKYRPAKFSRNNYVLLEDGKTYMQILDLRVKGKSGLLAVPTEKELKNSKTEFVDASGNEIKLKDRTVYSQYQQNSFVVIKPLDPVGSSKDAMLGAQIYDAVEDPRVPITMHYPPREVEISVKNITAVFTDDKGNKITNSDLKSSDLIERIREPRIKFYSNGNELTFDANVLDIIKEKLENAEKQYKDSAVFVPTKAVLIEDVVATMPDGTTRTNLEISDLISLMGESKVKFSYQGFEINFNADLINQLHENPDVLIPPQQVNIDEIVAILPDGSRKENLTASELITLSGDAETKFFCQGRAIAFDANLLTSLEANKEALEKHYEDLDILTHLPEEITLPATAHIQKNQSVAVDKIYEMGEDGAVIASFDSVADILKAVESGKTNFCVLDDDGKYYSIDPLNSDLLENIELEEGKYVLVRLKGEDAHTVCPIENLRLDDGTGHIGSGKLTAKDLLNCVGEKIWALGEDGRTPYELEPLTENEIVSFNSRKFYYETTKDSDICRDDNNPSGPQASAHLRLKDGTYVKESDVVQPKCYNFATGTRYDAYIVTLDGGTESERSYIIDKDRVDHSSKDPMSLIIGGDKVDFYIAEAKKVVKSAGGINHSDIIQTTSTPDSSGEKCEVLNTRKLGLHLLDTAVEEDADKKALREQITERVKKIYGDFLEKYKAKQYDLGGEVLIMNDPLTDGEFKPYLENHRYVLSDLMPTPDFTLSDIKEYLNMPDGGFVFDGEKLKCGPKYDYNKGVKNSFAKWGQGVANSLAFTFSWGGALASIVCPFLLVGLAVGTIAWGVGIPIYHARKRAKINAQNSYENKIEHQNEKIKGQIFEKMEDLLQDLKNGQAEFEKSLAHLSPEEKNAKIEERKQFFLSEMALLDTQIDMLSASKSGSQFDMVDGKGKVTQANAHEYSKYAEMLRERKNEIEAISKDIKKTEEKIKKLEGLKNPSADQLSELDELRNHRQVQIDQLSVKNNEFQDIRTNYRITGSDNLPDSEQQVIRDRVNQVKGFVMVKYFGESALEETGFELTEAEKAEKQQIEEYIKATDIIVDKHKHDFKYVHEYTEDKSKKVSWREWKKREKAFKKGSFFARLLGKGKASKLEGKEIETKNAYSALTSLPEPTPDVSPDVSPDVVEEVVEKPTPVKTSEVKADKQSIVGLTASGAEDIIKKVCEAMEQLQELTTSQGTYGTNDLTEEDEATVEELKEVFEYNKNVLKAVINKSGKFHKSLYNKYANEINKAGLRYKEYMSIVENRSVRL